ncbi:MULTISPECIES: GumC family protein [Azorhizobium]|uniref:Putative polysaccharide export protein n=1 Tax=Azorhizobium caulinodans (strain ATCC 43989 / DSM 5975 / JCM 20966 / LMG 6465 / NBRC 14845 / NCIMB 13405 / ORS 571) TaxID=438753 RepID=A8HZV3_AZOC5|nr:MULTISPECIES: polysaccharide export protein [Azorhizobium]TDT91341.1 polysaccharide chain length determinant protein (PEP-CTERM system associated) [Azorhizobium sp. AG788]BAF90629.1 putative polysaccharide export protein [Azorhizobium caulinodans ORS 571]
MFETASDTFAYVAQVAWRRRFLAIIPILLLPPLALVAAAIAPARYEARMTLLVQEPSKLNPILNDIAVNPNLKERMSALIALAHSEVVLGKVLEDLHRVTPETPPKQRDDLVKALSEAVTIQLVGSDIIEMRVRSMDPNSPAQTLQALSRRFVERLVSPERTAVQDSERFLKDQMSERRRALDGAEKALLDFRTANADKLPALYNSTVQRLATLEQQLQSKEMDLSIAGATMEELRKRLASTNPLIGRIEENIVQASAELASLRARYTDEHSLVQAAEWRLQRLEEERRHLLNDSHAISTTDLDRLWNIAAGVGTAPAGDQRGNDSDRNATPLLVSQLQRLQEQQSKRTAIESEVDQLRKVIAVLQRDIAEFGPIDQQQQQLERQVSFARDNYESLAKRYEMARVTGALGVFEAPERVKVLETPSDPASKVTPGYALYVLAGIISGFAVGGALAAASELLDTRLRRPADFARILGVPVIARVPRISPQEAQPRPYAA